MSTPDTLDGHFDDNGEFTPAGADIARWIERQRRADTAWATIAREVELHPRVAQHLHTTWCRRADQHAADAQHSLF